MVEGAALEMLCPERDPGFESLTLRQQAISGCFVMWRSLLGDREPPAANWQLSFLSLFAVGIGSNLCQISFSIYCVPGLTSRQYPPYGEQHKENTAAAKMVIE